jgi:ubiquinone/menaquinone biosynthesis C-methylase UbiE
MAHHHSHSIQQPAQTEGRLIRWAPYYDLAVNITTFGQARRLRKLTVDNALIKPGDSVLDVGCGTGAVTVVAKTRAGKAGKVYGIDPAPEMVAVARSKASRKGLGIDFRVGVIESLPFPDARLYVVTSSSVSYKHLTLPTT